MDWLRNYVQAFGAGLAAPAAGNDVVSRAGAGLYGSTSANSARRSSEAEAALAEQERAIAAEERSRDRAMEDEELDLKRRKDSREAKAADYDNLKTAADIQKLEAEGSRLGLTTREMLEVERLTQEFAKRLQDAFVEPDELEEKLALYRSELLRRTIETKRGHSGVAPPSAPTSPAAPAAPSAAPSAPTATQPSTPAITDGRTATNPTTGERLIFKNGAWQPLG
jgi:hypothetical protein